VSPVCSRFMRRCSRACSNRFAFAFWDSAMDQHPFEGIGCL
jgi:hypothetical protein